MFRQLVMTTFSNTLILNLSEEVSIEIQLTEREADQLRSMCIQFYSERQMTIIDLATNPVPVIADFSEVPPE